VILALPMQAVAAAGMQHCGAAHHLMQVGALAAAASYGLDPAPQATPRLHADADTGLVADPSGDDSSGASLSASPLNDDFTCSACANCCSAVALPSSVVRFRAPAVEARAAALPASGRGSFVPDGIDRPPRTFLA
jgi:hypothetical protein